MRTAPNHFLGDYPAMNWKRVAHAIPADLTGKTVLGVKKLRTGLSWADSHRPNFEPWFDRQMKALEEFDVTVTFCFTPGSCGKKPHHTSPPHCPEEFADFCARMVRRYT